MSVLKNKRKASQFEVFHHLYRVREDITDLLLRDFGYRFEQASTGEHGYTLQPVKEGGISQCTKLLWLTVLC